MGEKTLRFFLNDLFLMVILIFSMPSIIHGQESRAIQVVPDIEERSAIVCVDGYAQLAEDMTIQECRAMAFANAKRQALESARTYVQSKTMVKNFVLQYDLIEAGSEGYVTVLEQKDLGIEQNTRYHVWIKAEVKYVLKPPSGEPAQNALMDAEAPLTVKVWTEKKLYRSGERIVVFIQGNRDFYARIVDINSKGEIIQLLPNDFRKTNFFKGGQVYKIPDTGDRFELKVAPPYGEDRIVVYASEVPLGNVAMDPVGQGLRRYRGEQKDLAFATRGLQIVGKEGPKDKAEFYEATWALTTKE